MDRSRRLFLITSLFSLYPIYKLLEGYQTSTDSEVGIVFDLESNDHYMPGHLESPLRLEAILEEIHKLNLLKELRQIKCEPLTIDQLKSVHDEKYLSELQKFDEPQVRFLTQEKWSPYINRKTFNIANRSAGMLYNLTKEVWRGKLKTGISLNRPPGHHAERNRGRGFCLLNNVALSAQLLINEFGAERVCILDLDVDHGNGTQKIFYKDPRVLYASIHQWPFWPYSGTESERGEGEGLGYNINVPMPYDTKDEDVLAAFDEKIYPEVIKFRPQIILLSSGYDMHWRDPLGTFKVTLTGVRELHKKVHKLSQETCNGKLVISLEGGYNLKALAEGVSNTVNILLNKDALSDSLGTPL